MYGKIVHRRGGVIGCLLLGLTYIHNKTMRVGDGDSFLNRHPLHAFCWPFNLS